MAAQTLQQLRARTLDFLRETSNDSHFTADQLNGYLNQAQDYIAAVSAPPEDLISVAVQANVGRYNLASDHLLVTSAYYGTTQTANDNRPLTLLSKRLMKDMFPSWLDQHADSSGQPTHGFQYDNATFYIHPRPNASEVGKRLFLFYGFSPTVMTADGDTPSIKNNYHLLLPLFACRMAYFALSQPAMAKEMMAAFLMDFNAVRDTIEKESEETFAFKWGMQE